MDTCGTAESEETKAAQAALSRKKPPRSFSDAADENIALAAKLWKQQSCTTAAGDPTPFVIAKLSR